MNPVFEQYMLEQAKQAVNVFRSFNKEDFIDEFADTGLSLIDEAFNDVETLLNYSSVIGTNNNISMEECGFIASHINSIERKYKGVVDFNIVASESQDAAFRATLVSEALGKGAIAVILALISAIIGFIFMWKKKDKTEITAKAEAEIKETDEWIERMKKAGEESLKKQEAILREANFKENREHQAFSFTSHSKFLEHNFYGNSGNNYLKESDYERALDNLNNRINSIRGIFDSSKLMSIGLGDAIDDFVKIVRKNSSAVVDDVEKRLKQLDDLAISEGGKVKRIVKDISAVAFEEIKSHRLAIGFTVRINSSKLSLSKGPFDCIFANVNDIRKFNEKCKSYENDSNLPWSRAGLKDTDRIGLGLGGNTIQNLEKLIKDIDSGLLSDIAQLKSEDIGFILRTAKDLVSAFTTMTRQTYGLIVAFRKEQNYAVNFIKELAKQSALRIEKLDETRKWLSDKAKGGKVFDPKAIGEWADKVMKDMEDPNVKTIQI